MFTVVTACQRFFGVKAFSLILDMKRDLLWGDVYGNPSGVYSGMVDGIGDRLLGDAVQVAAHGGGQAFKIP